MKILRAFMSHKESYTGRHRWGVSVEYMLSAFEHERQFA